MLEATKNVTKLHQKTIFDNISEVVLLVDIQGIILFINQNAKDFIERTRNKIPATGESIFDFLADQGNKGLKETFARVWQGESIRYDQKISSLTGEASWWHFNFNPVYNIENISSICITGNDITLSKLTEEKLKESLLNYRYLFHSNPMPLWIYDLETFQFLEVNDAAVLRYGYTREEFLNMTIMDIRPDEDVTKLKRLIRIERAETSFYNGIWVHQLKNKQIIQVEITSYLIEYNGRKASLVLALDRTEQLRAEEQKEFEKKDKEAMINTTDELIWSVSRSLELIAANQSFIHRIESATGITLQPGDDVVRDSFPPDFVAFWKTAYLQCLSGVTFKRELYSPPMKSFDGGWSETSFNPIWRDGKIVGIACYSRNITEQKLAEEQLRQSESHLAEAQRVAKLGSWNLDLISGKLTWSDQLYDVFGTNKNTFTETHNSFVDLVNPEDREFVKSTSQKTQETGESFKIEYHITTPKGEKRIIQEHGYGEKDENGKVVRLFGTAQDITEQKKIQQQLILSEQQLAVIYNTIKDIIFMICIEKDGRFSFISVNRSFLEVLEMDSSQVVGKYAEEIFPPESWEMVRSNYQKAIDTKSTVQWEEISQYPSGTKTGFVSITPVVDAQGNCDRLVGSIHDITESKKAEALILESEKRYRSLFEQNLAGFYQSTLKGVISNCNDAFARMLKYDSPAELISTNASKLYFSPEDRNHFIASASREKNLNNYEGVLKCKDGSKLFFLENISVRTDSTTGEEYCDGIILDITQKKLLEEKVEQDRLLKQKEITDAVFEAQEKERSEIGRELHDNITQILGAVRLYIDMARTDSANRDALLVSSSNHTLKAIDEIRNLSKSLITPLIEERSLSDSVKDLIDQIKLVHPIGITFTTNNFNEKELSNKFKINLFRILQEQLNNILKHAKAKNVLIKLEESSTRLLISVSDDGIGFDPSVKSSGVGITNIRSRCELYNGVARFTSGKRPGTTLTLQFNRQDLSLRIK